MIKGPAKVVRFLSICLLIGLSSRAMAKDASAEKCVDLPQSEFLKPYIAELVRETPKESLKTIKLATESDLIKFHRGYGTMIRNKWLRKNSDTKLVSYFKCKGITNPDEMSMEIIRSLWRDLNLESK